jgi:hypothetical protein
VKFLKLKKSDWEICIIKRFRHFGFNEKLGEQLKIRQAEHVARIAGTVSVCQHERANLRDLDIVIRFAIPVVFVNKLEWSVCTGLTQLYLMVEVCVEFTA